MLVGGENSHADAARRLLLRRHPARRQGNGPRLLCVYLVAGAHGGAVRCERDNDMTLIAIIFGYALGIISAFVIGGYIAGRQARRSWLTRTGRRYHYNENKPK